MARLWEMRLVHKLYTLPLTYDACRKYISPELSTAVFCNLFFFLNNHPFQNFSFSNDPKRLHTYKCFIISWGIIWMANHYGNREIGPHESKDPRFSCHLAPFPSHSSSLPFVILPTSYLCQLGQVCSTWRCHDFLSQSTFTHQITVLSQDTYHSIFTFCVSPLKKGLINMSRKAGDRPRMGAMEDKSKDEGTKKSRRREGAMKESGRKEDRNTSWRWRR